MSTGPIAAGWPDESAEAGAVRRRRTIILGVIAAVLAIIVAVATVIVVATHDSGRSADLSLVAETSTGDDPFSPSVSLTNKPLRNDVRLAGTTGTYTGRGVRAVAGNTTGLYGGTENSTCDVAKLANFLSENPDKGRAWAGVFGISRSEIPYYLDSLTPVVLTSDTWVTNHSYAGGEATPFQAILQTGTAVLVDDAGVPRVRCSCGNPLAPSASAPLSRYNVTGNRWKGYQPTNVVYVSYNTTNNTTNVAAPAGVAPTPAALSLVNTDTAGTLMRTVGGLLDLAGLPPLAAPLPTAASLNVPFRSDDAAVQSANGVGSRAVALAESASLEAPAPAPAQARSEGSASSEVAPPVADPNLAAPVPTTAASSGVPAPSSPAAPAPIAPSAGPPVPETIPPTPAAAPPSPTGFTGSGASVVALTFAAADGVPVSCTVPEPVAETTAVETTSPTEVPTTTTETSTEAPVETTTAEPTVTEAPTAIVVPSSIVEVTLSCNSPVVYTADISDLTSAAVTTATGTDGIWTAPLEADGVRAATPIMTATYGR
ncbi:DUF6777 domain-containing protein [Williamsia maris]|nr:DUF6777 domain-containing protein [Williamsia maris]